MFKRKKKKTGCETPEFRSKVPMPPVKPARANPNLGWQPTSPTNTKHPAPPTSGSNAVKPNPNYVPPASVAKSKTNENTTMYGLKLYIPFEDLDAYIHEHIEAVHKDHTFIPVKVEVNELDLGVEISLITAVPNELDSRNRYKLDLNKLSKEN